MAINLFGDPDYRESLNLDISKYDQLEKGDGKHFVVAWIGDQGIETEFVCEWPEDDDKAPCYDPGVGDGCRVKYTWDNIGHDLMEKNEDESQLLKVKFPVGYRTEGHGDDFEDYIFSVRPNPESGVES